ncbi:unnamed protein product [Orchesella dallaii]|uniref:Uncharacterized protein n=1 Tax=Orchesella dallaii TaxID=48710 RepID=A0ABP1QYC0_9HEXA
MDRNSVICLLLGLCLLILTSAEELDEAKFTKFKDEVCDQVPAFKGEADKHPEWSNQLSQSEVLELAFVNIAYGLSSDTVGYLKEALGKKRAVIDMISLITKATCADHVISEMFLNSAKNLFLYYMVKNGNTTKAEGDEMAKKDKAWEEILEALSNCAGAIAPIDIATVCGTATTFVGQDRAAYPIVETVERLDTEAAASIDVGIDVIIDTVWWMFSTAYARCYSHFYPNEDIMLLFFQLFRDDFLSPFASRWREAGINVIHFDIIFGPIDSSTAAMNVRKCASAAYQYESIPERQLVRPVTVLVDNIQFLFQTSEEKDIDNFRIQLSTTDILGVGSKKNMDLSQDMEGFEPICESGIGRGRGRGFKAIGSISRTHLAILSVEDNGTPRLASSSNLLSDEHGQKASSTKGASVCPEFELVGAHTEVKQVSSSDKTLEAEGNEILNEEFQKNLTIGTKGTRCECLTNFVQLTKDKDVPVFEYHVAFSEFLESTNMKKHIMKQLVKAIGPVHNFDGQILYLPKRLPNDITMFSCNHPTAPAEEVEVTIKFKMEKEFKDLGPFYTILFKRIMICLGFTEIRKGFYESSEIRVLPQHKLQVWPGVAVTVEVKDGGLMLMIASPNRILREDTVHDHYKAMREKDPENFRRTFSDFVIGKIVLCGYSHQCYKIDDISWDTNPLCEFKYGMSLITYKDYFKTKYNVTVKDLDQPLLISKIKPRKRYNPDETIRMVALVPELCNLTGLTSNQRQNYKIVTEIQTITNLNPQLKINSMRSLLTKILRSTLAKKIFKDWGIRMDADVKSLIARRIEGPKVAFKKDCKEKVVQDDFSKDASKSCYEPVEVGKFLILCTKNDAVKARAFENYYKLACTSVGIRVRSLGTVIVVSEYRPASFIKALDEHCDPAIVQFVIVIMPNRDDDVYAAVKSFCLTRHPVPSQCILSKTLAMRTIQTLATKICLQVNCKIGGSLWALKMPVKNIMILGMDVAHDLTRKNPSVIALIASINDSCTKYYSKSSFQQMHQEVSVSMRVLFIDALQAYKENNDGELPDRIVFFRDGGNAETFDVLKKYEVDICVEVLTKEYVEQRDRKMPAFSYVCVAKHFPEQIFLVTEGNSIINPQPGTIVDNTITQPFLYDFFCVSQKTRQGTLNPTHYTVLYETIPTEPDLMQQIAYNSTFVYYNWQGSVRVPAVIQYAHKLGKLISRAKINPCQLNETMNSTLYYL